MNTEDLGRVGVWLPLHHLPVETGRRIAVRVEDQGYGSLWGGEVIGGQEAFALYGTLLAATRRLVVGTGIATIWARPSATARAGAATLAEAYPGRFTLGLGTGNPTQAAQVGESYGQPLDRMRDYLAGLQREDDPEPAFPTVLAALGPRMLDLARDRADGAHTFLSPVEHTALARERLGPDKLLIPTQTVALGVDRDGTRRALAETFGGLPAMRAGSPYFANMKRLGYTAEELAAADGRVLDAMIAWGDEEAIARRIRAHLDAGADHVLLHPIPTPALDVTDQLDRLAALAPTP